MKFSPTLPVHRDFTGDVRTHNTATAGVMKGTDTLRAKLDKQSS